MTFHVSPSLWRCLVAVLIVTYALSGCALVPDALRSMQLPLPQVSSSPTGLSTPAAPVATKNDLETGSAHHVFAASGVTFTASYWSTLRMDRWSPAVAKPLTFCLTATLDTDALRALYLSRLSVVTTVDGPAGHLAPLPLLSDIATVSPGYLITTPYTYSQIFTIPAIPANARKVTLAISYEILVRSTPTSAVYAKQTATDELTIALTALGSGK